MTNPTEGTPAGQTKTPEERAAEDAKMAAEWEAAAGGDGADAAKVGDDGRILDQNEIDSLLGFDGDSKSAKTGIMELINSALVNYERLPMLDIVFDRLVR